MEKRTKTVLNIGWGAVNSLSENFSNYAAKGYMLTEMNDRTFTFTEAEPQKLRFMLYDGNEDDRKFKALSESGWKILCSHENHHMLINENPETEEKTQKNRGTYISAALLAAVFFYLDFRYIPTDTDILIAARYVIAAVCSCAMIFFIVKAMRE